MRAMGGAYRIPPRTTGSRARRAAAEARETRTPCDCSLLSSYTVSGASGSGWTGTSNDVALGPGTYWLALSGTFTQQTIGLTSGLCLRERFVDVHRLLAGLISGRRGVLQPLAAGHDRWRPLMVGTAPRRSCATAVHLARHSR